MILKEKKPHTHQPECHLYPINEDNTYDSQPLVEQNIFIKKEKEISPIPSYAKCKNILPQLIWENHEDTVSCYNKAWEIGFRNLHAPKADDGMVSNYIDSAFNDFLFMWDSAFITMFGKYGVRAFSFQNTLDNFYANQHKDGFICRAICEKAKGDRFHRHDPAGTGPNILAWAEWEYYQITGDLERIKAVFAPILAYHFWLKKNRTWPDGSYWSTGWACGMDNQPRLRPEYNNRFHHGHQIWVDTCIQQIISAQHLILMAKLIEETNYIEELEAEVSSLTELVNNKLWDEKTSFYYDLWNDNQLNNVKSIGAYWALIAGIVPSDKLDAFVAHLTDKNEFMRAHQIPSLSADHPAYKENGSYWRGGIWAPTNYMVLKGLVKNGYHELAHDIALNHVSNVTKVFNKTNTLWENYAPDLITPGTPAKRDFVGWTGLSPIAITIEHVFGIQSSPPEGKITFRIYETDRHGVLRYPYKDGYVDLICPAHKPGEKPKLQMNSTVPVTIEVIWPDETTETHRFF